MNIDDIRPWITNYFKTKLLMEKFRKWTDQATGINPYIQVQPKQLNWALRILMFVVGLAKICLWVPIRYLLIFSIILTFLVPVKSIRKILIETPIKLLLYLLSIYQKDHFSFQKITEKLTIKGTPFLVLSNSSSVVDAFYYIATISPVRFVMTNKYETSDENGQFYSYEAVTIFKVLVKVTTKKQPFFQYHKQQKPNDTGKQKTLKGVIEKQLQEGRNMVFFYEGIKTNGLGTVNPSKDLAEKLFNLERSFVINHLRFTSSTELNSMVNHPMVLLFRFMRATKVSLKARAKLIEHDTIHSKTEMLTELRDFIKANSSKLLEIQQQGYFDFLEYHKQNS